VDIVAPQLSFFFAAQSDLLEEIAKFRAARRLWGEFVQERYSPRDPRSAHLRFHAQTAGVTLTAQQAEVNAVRVAYQALAAVLGGAQSLHTNAMDEALGLPTEASVRLALRTQQVLAHESGVANTVDPVGGAYALEWLTEEITDQARKVIERIDALGGAPAALEKGYQQREIAESAYRLQREVEEGSRVVVGVNAFRTQETPMPTTRLSPDLEKKQTARLKAFRKRRSRAQVTAAVDRLRKAAEGDENLVPPILAAVKASCTLGEISDALREVFGEYRPRQEV
jgi:methylmalonyl-CoA mutase N-terminal domain/subunit